DIAKQAFNGIGATNVPMHDLWKGIQRQKMVFILTQAADRFGRAQGVFPECSLPMACVLPPLAVISRSQPVRSPPPCAHDGQWRSSHCVVCAPNSAGVASRGTEKRLLPRVHHAHR